MLLKNFFSFKYSFLIIFIVIIIIPSNNLTKLKDNENNLSPSSERNDEVGGSLFDNLNMPDEKQSENLNNDANETGENAQKANNDDTGPYTQQELLDEQLNEAKNKKQEQQKKEKEKEKEEEEEKEEEKKEEEEEKKEEIIEEEEEKIVPSNNVLNGINFKNISPSSSITHDDINNLNSNFSLLYKVHNPSTGIEKSVKTKMWSICTIVLFGFFYLFFRIVYNYLKNYNKLISKCISSLANQIMLLFICFTGVIIFYTFGSFDNISINWEYLIAGLALFLISWIIFSIYIIVLCSFIVKKWQDLEKNCDSFKNLRHKFDPIANKQYEQNNNNDNNDKKTINQIIEKYEYLILKKFVFIPLFPILKASTLRKEMDFSVYLQKCLIDKIRLTIKFSWTCWIFTIILMMFWNVFIVTNSPGVILFFIIVLPLFGIGITLIIYLYCKIVYRKVIEKITQNNMSDYQDSDFSLNNALQSKGYPIYLKKIILDENEYNKLNQENEGVHYHMHNRPPSLYEENMILGATGFAFILNAAQACAMILCIWSVVIFAKHSYILREKYHKFIYAFLIFLLIIYFSVQGFLISILLKWYSIIDSIEMKRNEKCIKKLIDNQLRKNAEIAEKIFQNFKKIYFDIKTNIQNDDIENNLINDNENNEKQNELDLTFPHLQELIRTNLYRYTKSQNDNNMIDIKNDLVPFMKSFGSVCNNQEIHFMLHLIANFHEFKGKLTINNLFNIYGAILHFRTIKPLEIIKFVFNNFYKNNQNLYRETHLTYNNIEVFTNNYHNYFTKEECEFIKEQCKYLGESFTLDGLMINILSLRQYYPY